MELIQEKVKELYQHSNYLKSRYEETFIENTLLALFSHPVMKNHLFLEADFMTEIEPTLTGKEAVAFIFELINLGVFNFSYLLECSCCTRLNIRNEREIFEWDEAKQKITVFDIYCSNCLNKIEADYYYLRGMTEINTKHLKEYAIGFYLSKDYYALIRAWQNRKKGDTKKDVYFYSPPLKTKAAFEDPDPHASLKRGLIESRKNPLNFSVWHEPMVQLLEGNPLIRTIPSSVYYLSPALALAIYEGVSKEKEALLAEELLHMISEEWLKKEEVFIRTGTFSNKFNFVEPHVKDIQNDLLTSYLQIAHDAVMCGADMPSEIVLREFIPNNGNRPTIYHGLPLNTEFRYFYDFDKEEFVGVANYWHPELMIDGLQHNAQYDEEAAKDLQTYKAHQPLLTEEFQANKARVGAALADALQKNKEATGYQFKGVWSIDIMMTGDDFYFIDMALGSRSALVHQIEPLYEEGDVYDTTH